jgi:hypothetical protein
MRPIPAASPSTAVPPAAPTASEPVTTASLAPPSKAAVDNEPVVIVDEDLVARREAAVAAVLDDEPAEPDQPFLVDDGELEEWDSGSLADYLERRGLISDGGDEARTDFDEDGFFLDEGPNRERLRPRLRRDFFF